MHESKILCGVKFMMYKSESYVVLYLLKKAICFFVYSNIRIKHQNYNPTKILNRHHEKGTMAGFSIFTIYTKL